MAVLSGVNPLDRETRSRLAMPRGTAGKHVNSDFDQQHDPPTRGLRALGCGPVREYFSLFVHTGFF